MNKAKLEQKIKRTKKTISDLKLEQSQLNLLIPEEWYQLLPTYNRIQYIPKQIDMLKSLVVNLEAQYALP